jgi:hypothetical protein
MRREVEKGFLRRKQGIIDQEVIPSGDASLIAVPFMGRIK